MNPYHILQPPPGHLIAGVVSVQRPLLYLMMRAPLVDPTGRPLRSVPVGVTPEGDIAFTTTEPGSPDAERPLSLDDIREVSRRFDDLRFHPRDVFAPPEIHVDPGHAAPRELAIATWGRIHVSFNRSALIFRHLLHAEDDMDVPEEFQVVGQPGDRRELDPDTLKAFVDLARKGREQDFKDMALIYEVPADRVQAMWDGTRQRLGFKETTP